MLVAGCESLPFSLLYSPRFMAPQLAPSILGHLSRQLGVSGVFISIGRQVQGKARRAMYDEQNVITRKRHSRNNEMFGNNTRQKINRKKRPKERTNRRSRKGLEQDLKGGKV